MNTDHFLLINSRRYNSYWKGSAAQDVKLEELDDCSLRLLKVVQDYKVQTTRDTHRPRENRKGTSTTPEEADAIARGLAAKDASFTQGTAEEWSEAVKCVNGKTCSPSTISKTALWQECMKQQQRGKTRGPTPKTVTLSRGVQATHGEGKRHEVLEELCREEERKDQEDAAKAIEDSSMPERYKQALITQLAAGINTPKQVIQMANTYPQKKNKTMTTYKSV